MTPQQKIIYHDMQSQVIITCNMQILVMRFGPATHNCNDMQRHVIITCNMQTHVMRLVPQHNCNKQCVRSRNEQIMFHHDAYGPAKCKNSNTIDAYGPATYIY